MNFELWMVTPLVQIQELYGWAILWERTNNLEKMNLRCLQLSLPAPLAFIGAGITLKVSEEPSLVSRTL